MSDKKRAIYFAGVFDGEGTCTIGAGKKETCINYNAVMSVTNTDKRLIDWIQQNFGGWVVLAKRQVGNQNEAWMWRSTKKDHIEKVLLMILPYLIVKREQAKVLLNFVRLPRFVNDPELRKNYWQQLRILNHRGVSLTTNTQDAFPEAMIESELIGDDESGPSVN
jgi:hypothetical protein